MKIEKVDIPEDKSLGLGRIYMPRTENLILIAGKNGSGKTRILSQIKSALLRHKTRSRVNHLEKELDTHYADYQYFNGKLDELVNFPPSNSNSEQEMDNEGEINTYKNKLQDLSVRIDTLTSELDQSEIETSELSNSYQCFDFVPKTLDIIDSYDLSQGQLITLANQLNLIGIASTHESTFAKIQYVQNQCFNATHQDSSVPLDEKEELALNYTKLNQYIKMFLDTDLSRSKDGDAEIFGRRLGESNLSDGQKILLQLCLALYTQESKLSDLIIFMDEPENHLHPKALIEVVDKLFNALSEGQLWIATHSINLLAHFDQKHIWYVEDGNISFSGNVPERVLEGLIGDSDELEKLSNFLTLPAQMATNKFSFECLLPPKTLVTGSNDPQTNQIINSIKSLKKENKKMRVLDFGAGKGRLLSTIFDTTSNEFDVTDWLDYYAYDLPSTDEEECKKTLKMVYGEEGENRYFNNETRFIENTPEKSFDVIIMCNVFHEIDPIDWLNLFKEHTLIPHALSDDGTLLIVEDQLIPVGEKAYKNGFLVFDKAQFKKLFKIDNYQVTDARNDGRLKAHFLESRFLKNIDSQSRITAIENLQETAKRNIKMIREDQSTFKNGKLHGFWIQQLANAQLSLDNLK